MALEHESDSAIARAVRAAGSQSAFGRLLRRKDGKPVSQSTVNDWLKSGRAPGAFVLKIEDATGVSRHDLDPELYPRSEVPVGSSADLLEPDMAAAR